MISRACKACTLSWILAAIAVGSLSFSKSTFSLQLPQSLSDATAKPVALAEPHDFSTSTVPISWSNQSLETGNSSSSKLAQCLLSKPRPWLLWIGDSNSRNAYEVLVKDLTESGYHPVASSPGWKDDELEMLCNKDHFKQKKHRCCPRWFDNETLLEAREAREAPNFIRLSFRFAICAELRLQHVIQNASLMWQCCEQYNGILLGDQECSGRTDEARLSPSVKSALMKSSWKVPSILIFAHGFWHVTACGKRAGKCVLKKERPQLGIPEMPRHDYLALQLKNIESESNEEISVLWGTLFPTASGPGHLKPEEIEKDYACQKAAAQKYGVKLLDIWPHTALNPSQSCVKYHFKDHIARLLYSDIVRAACSPKTIR
eukprot:Skav225447  [mRNA]  locus=scaffold1668:252689:253810:- [translate_table: standard]